jgi:transglutaminase/protease-like cytokinesis protein 3
MQNNRRYPLIKAITTLLLTLAMVITMLPMGKVQAATVKLNTTKKTLYVGKTQQLTLKNYKKTVLWTSSDKSVASVDGNGLVTALKKGSATITATTAKGSTFTCTIKVKNPYVSPKTATLKEGETLQLKVVGAKAVSWSSTSKAYAKVGKTTGLVTAVKARDSVVTIKAKCDNGKTYKCKVTIIAADNAGTGDNTGDNAGTGDNSGTGSEPGTGDNSGTGTNPGTGDDTGTGDDSGKTSDEYYGIRNPQKKTAYREEITFDTPITSNEQLASYAREALRAGAKRFTIKVANNEDTITGWFENFYKLFSEYCAFSGYGNQYMYGYKAYETDKYANLTIEMIYKDGWKAVVFLQHTGYEADATVKKLLEVAQGIVDDAVKDSSDLKKQLLYINNRLCEMGEYDNWAAMKGLDSIVEKIDGVYKITPPHDATGILLNGKGVCEAYASAYQLCLEILGVENYIMTSYDGAHVWNRVKVDGKWYHVDVTWNDTTDNSFFLLDDDQFISETKKTGNSVENHTWYTDYMPE